MIFTDRKITIRNGKSTINEPVILYRGDYEVSIKFTIMESKFRFKSGVNLVDSEKASHGQLAILTPYGGNVFSEIVKCEDGTVTFTLTKEMIDQLEEVGLYSFQIRLFDYYRESRVSMPPVEFGIEVREPVASEDQNNEVDDAIVGYSIARYPISKVTDGLNEDVPDTFDGEGQYNKTEWETGDRISQGKLNKIEDALDKINQNDKTLDRRITNNFNILTSQLEHKANKLEIGSPLIANSISEMKDITKVYVNTSDGNWYSYNENKWVVGGLYNSQGIGDKTITANKTDFIDVSPNIINPTLTKDGYALDYTWNSANIDDYVVSPSTTAYQDTIEAKSGDVFYSNVPGRCVWYNSSGIVSGNLAFERDNETGLYRVTVGGGVKVKFDAYISEINSYDGYWFVCKAPYVGVKQEYGVKILSDDIRSNMFAKEKDLLDTQKNVNSLLKPTLDSTFFIPKNIYCLKGAEKDKWLFKQNIILSKNYNELYLDNTAPNGACRGINGDLRTQSADDIKVKSSKDNSVLYRTIYNRRVADYEEKTNPSEIKNILVVGDSLSDAGYIPCDIKDQLVNKFGFTNFNFIGTKTDTLMIEGTNNTVTCKNEGRGGYTIDDFMKSNNDKGRGAAYPNPFLNNGIVSIKNYMSRNNFDGDLDYLIVELGTNNIVAFNNDPTTIKGRMSAFINMILTEYPNCKVFVCGLLCISKINETYDFITHNSKVLNVNKEYEALCETEELKNNCVYVDINTFFDVEFGYPYSEFKYRGSNEIKKKIIDWLHPSKAGYYMVCDTIVSAFVYKM